VSGPTTKAELGLVDFGFFCEWALGIKHYVCQKVWADDFQTVVDGDYTGYQLMAPADHGKTSTVLAPGILWLLARDRDSRIGLGGSIDAYSQQIARVCMSHIEKNPVLEKEYGLAKGDKWAVNEFTVARDNWRERSPSVLAFGVGAEIQSQRFDWIFGDDLATRRNSRSEGQRAALRSYIMTDLNSRLDQKPGMGKEIYMGHRVDANDFYSDNMARDGWLYRTDKAIVDDAEQKVLCPEKWTYAKLAEKRARDPIGFELLYQQQAVATGRFITRTSMERVRVPGLRFHTSMTGELRSQFRTTWLSLDPAFTTTRWSSYAVLGMWGMTHGGKIRLIWAVREKMTAESLLPLCEMKFRLYMPDHFFIEDNAAQTMIVSHMRRKFPDHGSKFRGVTTINKDGRLEEEMVSLFELYNQEIPVMEIPYHGPTEQAYAHAMTEEYVSYPNGKSRDMLMMQYIGLKGIGKLANEERRGSVLPRGIMGAVSDMARDRHRFRRIR